MKTINLFLTIGIILILFFGCSSNNDSNENSITTAIPVSPTNLIGTVVSTAQISLSWTDNSTNETGFKIERRTGAGNYAIVGTVNADVLAFNDIGLTPGTTYIYRVYSYNTAGNSPTYTNELTRTKGVLTTLTTRAAFSITINSALCGGNIVSDVDEEITARGLVWSTSSSPTIALSTKTIDGTGIGSFTSSIAGLTSDTRYYARIYATTSTGTTYYGNEINFNTLRGLVLGQNVTDIDGNTYQSVIICNQTWTKTNLNVSKFTDGTIIPQVSAYSITNYQTPAWCYYSNDPGYGAVYGKLYNWYAVAGIYDEASRNDPSLRKKLAPSGWHIPTGLEFVELVNCAGGNYYYAGDKLKEVGTVHWQSNTTATNESGFTGLPGGYVSGGSYDIGRYGYWRDSTRSALILGSDSQTSIVNMYDYHGISVRCVKD